MRFPMTIFKILLTLVIPYHSRTYPRVIPTILFPFSLKEETTKSLCNLLKDSISTWGELIEVLYIRFFIS